MQKICNDILKIKIKENKFTKKKITRKELKI